MLLNILEHTRDAEGSEDFLKDKITVNNRQYTKLI